MIVLSLQSVLGTYFLWNCVITVLSYNYVIYEEGSPVIGKEDKITFYVYRKKYINFGTAYDTELASSEKECFDLCYKTKCTDMNIYEETSDSFECHISTGKCIRRIFFTDLKHTYVSMNKPFSTSYCRNLRYLNPCGDCECIDEVNSDVQYYCNCTNVNPARDSCNWVKKQKQDAVTGIYPLNYDGKIVNALCMFKRSGKVELLIFKRINGGLDKDLNNFKTGFGKIGHTWSDTYFIGLDYLHYITSQAGTRVTLKMEFVEKQTMEHNILFYTEFKVDSESNGYKISYSGYDYHGKNTVYSTDFLNRFVGKRFGTDDYQYWWNQGSGYIHYITHHPFHMSSIYWYPGTGVNALARLKVTWTLVYEEP